jgi:arylformamidase
MYIDLTHEISSQMPYYPGTPAPSLRRFCTIEESGYTELEIYINTHTGTHIDAPAHIIPNGLNLNDFEISQFTGRAICIDCTSVNEITLEMISGNIESSKSVEFIVLKTGWSKKWGDKSYFEGFPVLTEAAARFIADKKIKVVCMDVISADKIEDTHLPVHNILLGSGVMIAENLNIPDNLPVGTSFDIYLIPLKFKEADGSPLRAFAKI